MLTEGEVFFSADRNVSLELVLGAKYLMFVLRVYKSVRSRNGTREESTDFPIYSFP